MTDYEYYFDIVDNNRYRNKVDIKLCRCVMVKFRFHILDYRDKIGILQTKCEVKKDKDSIQDAIDELKSNKDKYERIFDDNIERQRQEREEYLRNMQQEQDRLKCVDRMINDINGKPINK